MRAVTYINYSIHGKYNTRTMWQLGTGRQAYVEKPDVDFQVTWTDHTFREE